MKENLESELKNSILNKNVTNDGRTKENSALRGLVGEQPQGEGIYSTITEAAHYAGRGDSLAEKNRQGGWDKQSFLRAISKRAKGNKVWTEKVEDLPNLGKYLKGGQENEVYLSEDGKSVIKINNLFFLDADDSGLHTSDFNTFLDRLHSHNSLFDNVSYKITGFTKNSKGEISVILEQPYIKEAEYAPLRDTYICLRDNGFKPKKLSNGVDGFSNGKYEISDVKPENVLKDKNETFYFIDTDINSLKSGVTGKYLSGVQL